MPKYTTEPTSREAQIEALEKDWATNPRWKGIKRGYTAADVVRLRGSFPIEHTLAREVVEPGEHRALCQLPRRVDRRPSHAASQGRRQSHLPLWLAGGC